MSAADPSAAADAPNASNVIDLKVGQPDFQGAKVTAIHQRKAPEYGVYSNGDRVLVHFHDVKLEANKQRRALAPLLPLRDEIEGLLRGWRSGATGFFGLRNAARLKVRAECEDGRVGAALALALEDDVPGGQVQLEKIKSDILNERVANARFEYLLTAFLTALGTMFLAWLLASLLPTMSAAADERRALQVGAVLLALVAVVGGGVVLASAGRMPAWGRAAAVLVIAVILVGAILVWPATPPMRVQPDYEHGIAMWRAFAAGALGAVFSIAIAIRGRTVLADLLRTANIMDAVLRVTIGAMGGAVVMGLFANGTVAVNLANEGRPLFVLIVGFFAGFSERFVPDLLAKAVEKPADFDAKVAAARAERDKQAELRAASGAAVAAIPVAAAAGAPATPFVDDAAAANDNPSDDDEEVGAEGFELEDGDVTEDEELPPSAGGVASSG